MNMIFSSVSKYYEGRRHENRKGVFCSNYSKDFVS